MKRSTLTLIALLMLAGCRIGPSPDGYRPAHRPEGARADLTLSEQVLRGELLALHKDGLVVLVTDKPVDELAFVPFDAIQEGEFDQGKTLRLRNGKAPGARARERLRLMSRYPQGLSDNVLARLLAAYEQDELTTVP